MFFKHFPMRLALLRAECNRFEAVGCTQQLLALYMRLLVRSVLGQALVELVAGRATKVQAAGDEVQSRVGMAPETHTMARLRQAEERPRHYSPVLVGKGLRVRVQERERVRVRVREARMVSVREHRAPVRMDWLVLGTLALVDSGLGVGNVAGMRCGVAAWCRETVYWEYRSAMHIAC